MADPQDFDITKRDPPSGALADLLLAVLSILGGVITFPGAAAAGNAELIRQRALRDARPTLPTPTESVEGIHRGVIGQETYSDIMGRHGFTEDSAAMLQQISRPLLTVAENVVLWLRGELDDSELQAQLAKHGLTSERTDQLKVLAFGIPGVADLTTMAVREVFDIAQAAAFGQFEGVSGPSMEAFNSKFGGFGSGPQATTAAYETFAEQSGLSPEWATAFWAAHWQLPSPSQMFEMLQRDVIDRDTLEAGIRALDFTGPWRDRLLRISFNPITRVDIRRMHALGLLTDDDLIRRYQDVGFSPEDAELLKAFTIEFNAPDDAPEQEKLRDLTRAQILRFMRSGLFSRDEAKTSLITIGFSEVNADTILELEEIAIAQEDLDLQVATIKAKVRNGLLRRADAIAEIDGLDLPVRERDLIVSQIDREQVEAFRLPTRGELDAFALSEVIDIDTYVEEVERLGFPPPWPQRFAEQLIAKMVPDDDKRSFSRALVQKLLAQGLLVEDEAEARLLALGFSPEDTVILILQATLPEPEADPREFTRALIQKLFVKGIINEAEARRRFRAIEFRDEDIDILFELIGPLEGDNGE